MNQFGVKKKVVRASHGRAGIKTPGSAARDAAAGVAQNFLVPEKSEMSGPLPVGRVTKESIDAAKDPLRAMATGVADFEGGPVIGEDGEFNIEAALKMWLNEAEDKGVQAERPDIPRASADPVTVQPLKKKKRGTNQVNRNWTDSARINWKGLLLEAAQREVIKMPQKDDMEFAVDELEGVNQGPKYTATVFLKVLQGARGGKVPSYTGPDRTNTKKEAEQVACQVAMYQEYPEQYNNALQAHDSWIKGYGQDDGAKSNMRTDVACMKHSDPKQQLHHGCQLLSPKPLTKGDIIYEATKVPMQGFEGGMCTIATVNLTFLTEPRSFQGKPSKDKREAETSAAKVAVKEMADIIGKAAATRGKADNNIRYKDYVRNKLHGPPRL